MDTNQVSKSQRVRRSWCKRILVLLWQKFQYEAVSPLLWTWPEELSEGVGMGGICVVKCKFWNVGGLLQVYSLWFVEEFQNLDPEFVCLGSWFRNLIIF